MECGNLLDLVVVQCSETRRWKDITAFMTLDCLPRELGFWSRHCRILRRVRGLVSGPQRGPPVGKASHGGERVASAKSSMMR